MDARVKTELSLIKTDSVTSYPVIENVTSLESHVMSERTEKEVTPLAEMAVVAEDKAMYDTQKSVTDISEIPVETEIEKVGKSR